MALSITKSVISILESCPEKRMTAREIATEIMRLFPKDVEEKRQRSRATKTTLETDDAMVQQIVAEIGAQRKSIQKKESRIKTTEGRPRKYYFTEKSDVDEIDFVEVADVSSAEKNVSALELVVEDKSEASLYPMLTGFLSDELAIFSMRVDERRSKNSRGKGGNK